MLAAAPIEDALKIELDRAMSGLRLADAPAPYFVSYDLLQGQVTTVFTEFGATVEESQEPYRNLRVEVRVGDYEFDSSNFTSFGDPDGVEQRRLPVEDDVLALRREIWLATDSAYKHAVEQYARKQAARQGIDQPRPPDFSEAPPVVQSYELPAYKPENAAAIQRLAARLSGELRSWPDLELGQAVARDWQGSRLTLSSEGTQVWRPTGYVVVRVEGVIRLADGSRERDARSWVAPTLAELPPEEEMVAAVREMASWLVGLKDAPTEEDYLGPVLFEGQAAVELFSQMLVPELIGTPPIEEERNDMFSAPTPRVARLGRRLLPEGWDVVDDAPGHPDAVGSYPVDHEGVAPTRVELVVDGVVRDLLMSRIPSLDRPTSTGHGRGLGSERRGAMPAVVTVAPPKPLSYRRLLGRSLRLAAQTGRDYVLVVRQIEPPAISEDVDVTFSGEAPLPGLTIPMEVYRLYADGRKEPVRSVGFSAVDRRILRDIVAAGPVSPPIDMLDGPPGLSRYQIGPTGGVPVTWMVPPVLVSEVELVSRAGGEPRVLTLPARE